MSTGHQSVVVGTGQLEQERNEAFSLLGKLVLENYAANRRSYGASLKPELRRRTFDGFDERRLQFASFRRFLEAAKDADVIALHEPPKGPDLEATPPGKPSLAHTSPAAKPIAEDATAPPPRKRIRHDLWKAFVDWDARWRRAYDQEQGTAVRFPAHPAPLERPESESLRRLVRDQPDRFIDIDPILFGRQLEWMQDFTQTVSDPGARSALNSALSDDRPVRAFSQELQANPQLRHQWNATKLAHVEGAIRQWAEGSGLKLEIHEPAPVRGRGAARKADYSGQEVQAQRSVEQLHSLRSLLHVAIDRMPEAELLQIRLPVEYLVRP